MQDLGVSVLGDLVVLLEDEEVGDDGYEGDDHPHDGDAVDAGQGSHGWFLVEKGKAKMVENVKKVQVEAAASK